MTHPPLLQGNLEAPTLQIRAKFAPLYSPEMAAYLKSQFTPNFISIADLHTTETENGDKVQCMHGPFAARTTGTGLTFESLWNGSIETIEQASRAYFAASSSSDLNEFIETTLINWNMFAGSQFAAFHFPHALILTLSHDPFLVFEEMEYLAAKDEAEILHILDSGIQVYIDETLSAHEKMHVYTQVQDFLNRLAAHHNAKPPFNNISFL